MNARIEIKAKPQMFASKTFAAIRVTQIELGDLSGALDTWWREEDQTFSHAVSLASSAPAPQPDAPRT